MFLISEAAAAAALGSRDATVCGTGEPWPLAMALLLVTRPGGDRGLPLGTGRGDAREGRVRGPVVAVGLGSILALSREMILTCVVSTTRPSCAVSGLTDASSVELLILYALDEMFACDAQGRGLEVWRWVK